MDHKSVLKFEKLDKSTLVPHLIQPKSSLDEKDEIKSQTNISACTVFDLTYIIHCHKEDGCVTNWENCVLRYSSPDMEASDKLLTSEWLLYYDESFT